jgi:hypothetical protein
MMIPDYWGVRRADESYTEPDGREDEGDPATCYDVASRLRVGGAGQRRRGQCHR